MLVSWLLFKEFCIWWPSPYVFLGFSHLQSIAWHEYVHTYVRHHQQRVCNDVWCYSFQISDYMFRRKTLFLNSFVFAFPIKFCEGMQMLSCILKPRPLEGQYSKGINMTTGALFLLLSFIKVLKMEAVLGKNRTINNLLTLLDLKDCKQCGDFSDFRDFCYETQSAVLP